MALPWWLRGGLRGGAGLLKARLKRIKEGSEVVGKARKVLLAKLTKQLKALKDKKPKDKEPEKPKEKRTMSRKELMEHGERETKREKKKLKIDDIEDEFIKAQRNVEKPFQYKSEKRRRKQKEAVDAYHKAEKRMRDRTRMAAQDMQLRRRTGGGHGRSEHSITGKVKGDTDLRDFGRSLLKQDIRVAKHVKGLQELKKMRDMVKSGDLPKHVSKRLAREYGKHTRERVIYPKLAKPAKESFKRIQKKKDRFKKKDAKKKGTQGD